MSGTPTTCKDNRRLARTGCGAAYRGRQVHCTNPAPWSEHPDGLCHHTFGAYSTFDMHIWWDGSNHTNPAEVSQGDDGHIRLKQDEAGVWHQDDATHPWLPFEVGT